ncbi:GIY-YIG nuclease family protein [Achromobacter piechaudii]|uniref:GIY-YIG nuclease family protein n=1 Tax=Achromobacter piechaudii TaxID=72556 RepID=UPI003DAA2F93
MQKTGIYVLIGQDAELANMKRIYIGEGDTAINRISAHNKDVDKDFWDEAVVFVSKDDNLTKAHVRYVEARLIALAKVAKRSVVTNGTAPNEQGMLPEPDQVEMDEFIAQARLLLGALGYDIFELLKTSPPNASALAPTQQLPEIVAPIFKFAGSNYDATLVVDQNSGQFLVQSDSKARKAETPSLQPTYRNLREQLIQNGVLEDFDERSYRFTQDYAFSAPTPAAQVVCGTSANGRTAWKTVQENITFADWQDAQLPADQNA